MNLAMQWRYEQEEAWQREQLRLAAERGPLPRNAPELLAPTRVRVLRAFFVKGARVEPGARIELARHDALSLAALKRVEIVE